ncbi:MAG TPA: hypothetical protein VG602_07910 [Actinomycetota bacterium]|nr:hypothetical protein [Actinomycetota bacterium]
MTSERCGIHADRASVASCARCGRQVCLECAIPFRGSVLCSEDAARELGSPLPEPPRPQPSRRPEVVAVVLLALGLGATVPPWHGEGELTGVLSAWRPGLEPWAMAACVSLLLAAALAVTPLALRSGPRPLIVVGYALTAVLAAAAAAVTLVAAPDFFSPTPAPFVMAALCVATAAVGFIRLRSLRV